MGIVTAYPNQPYNGMAPLGAFNPAFTAPGATANTLASYIIPLSAPAASPSQGSAPTANASAGNNSSSGLGALPDIPPPSQIAPAVMGSSTGTSPYHTSQSVPVQGSPPEIPPVSDIPPPHMVAPWVFLQRGNNPPPLPQQPAQQPMPMQPQQPKLPQQPPQPQRPPQQQQPPPPPQQPQQPQQKKPSAELDGGALSDETIRSLNKRLEDPAEDVRADATIDLFKILEKNPKLADDPNYKPYIDAFAEKIMQDPSPLVRGGGELILKMGKIPNPSQSVRDQLKKLSTKDDLTSEGSITSDILSDIETGTLKKSSPPPAAGASPSGGTNQATPGATPMPGATSPVGNPSNSYYANAGGAPPYGQTSAGVSSDELAQQQAAMQRQADQQRTEQEKLNQQRTDQDRLEQERQTQIQAQQQELENQRAQLAAAQANAPRFGNRLNIISPQQAVYATAAYPQNGQRLNIQEGYR